MNKEDFIKAITPQYKMEEDKQKAIEMWHALHDAIKKTVCIDGCKLPMGKHGMCDGKCENKTMASPSPS